MKNNDMYVDYLKKNLDSSLLEDGLKKLESGISPQYIVGNVNFYGYDIKVNPSVLIPRFETELLVDKTIHYIKNNMGSHLRILDLGTGSGCIAITLKKEIDCHVVASDISEDAIKVALENASYHHVDIDFVISDIFSNIKGKFDVIISNPPYIRIDEDIDEIVYRNEPHLALYAKENGLYYYRCILESVKKYLNDNFLIAFEIGEKQGNDVMKLATSYLDDVCVFLEKDYSGRDRFVFIHSK